VIGASGLLGGQLVKVLSKTHKVIPTHNTQAIQPDSVLLVRERLVSQTIPGFCGAISWLFQECCGMSIGAFGE